MKVHIFSLQGIEFQGEAAGFNVKTQSGEITVLDHHLPLVTILKEGKANVLKVDGSHSEFSIHGGFLEVSPKNEVNVLIS